MSPHLAAMREEGPLASSPAVGPGVPPVGKDSDTHTVVSDPTAIALKCRAQRPEPAAWVCAST